MSPDEQEALSIHWSRATIHILPLRGRFALFYQDKEWWKVEIVDEITEEKIRELSQLAAASKPQRVKNAASLEELGLL